MLEYMIDLQEINMGLIHIALSEVSKEIICMGTYSDNLLGVWTQFVMKMDILK